MEMVKSWDFQTSCVLKLLYMCGLEFPHKLKRVLLLLLLFFDLVKSVLLINTWCVY